MSAPVTADRGARRPSLFRRPIARRPRVQLGAVQLGALALTGLLASGCTTSNPQRQNHWNFQSVAPSFVYHTTRYRPEVDGSYREFQWREKQHINLTLRRHFLNSNPYNPRQPEVPGYFEERPPHSILPDPLNYFHLSALVAGGVVSAASSSAVFIPIPYDSIVATLQPGGIEEFKEGIVSPDEKPISPYTRYVPPTPDEFEVKNAEEPLYVGS